MNYLFEIPNVIKIDKKKITFLRGGFADGKDKIYLYGFESSNVSGLDDILIWSDLITHEYLHCVLSRLGIKNVFHHPIIDKMEIEN